MESVNSIVARMRQALALSEPDLDTTVGTPVRKILDAVGEAIAEASVEHYILDYAYDIDAKSGADLDDLVRLFGFTRFPAKRAVGAVTFERTTAATDEILIPLGTQLSTDGVAPVIVQTITPALLVIGDTAITVPVQAVLGGSGGNVGANSIRRKITEFEGITSFTNVNALSGGADVESDEQLRDRFKRTVFRGMAGTEHMFLGIALDDSSVTQANVLGASKKFRETIEIVAGNGVSSLPADSIRYVYPDSSTFGTDLDIGDILTPNVHYTFTDSVPPEVDLLGDLADGVYELEYEYVPTYSRNDPENGITNRIDLYVNGNRPTEATELAIFDTGKLFVNDTPANPLHAANFLRADGVTAPTVGNFFVPLSFSPVTDPSTSDEIEIDSQTYIEDDEGAGNVGFWLVNDITQNGGTPVSLSGIEIQSNANSGPANPSDESIFTVNYIFNAVPRDIEVAARQWRLVTTDLRVHQAHPVYLDFYLAVIYLPGYPPSSVNPLIELEIERYISQIGFTGVVQVSDILSHVGDRVEGVDAIRFLTDDDGYEDEEMDPHWAIERVAIGGEFIERYENGGTPSRATDVLMGDHEYPVFNSITVIPTAQNRWTSV